MFGHVVELLSQSGSRSAARCTEPGLCLRIKRGDASFSKQTNKQKTARHLDGILDAAQEPSEAGGGSVRSDRSGQ